MTPAPLRLIQGGARAVLDAPGPEAILRGLCARQDWAARALVAQYGGLVRRVLFRILGSGDPDHEDLLQEVFARAFAGAHGVNDPAALPGWLAGIAVFAAREHIRRRQRGRGLRERLFGVASTAHGETLARASGPAEDARAAGRCVYRIFAAMPADERIALALRKIEGMELTELAATLGISVATVRRRLARAERRFAKLAARHEALSPWLGRRKERE